MNGSGRRGGLFASDLEVVGSVLPLLAILAAAALVFFHFAVHKGRIRGLRFLPASGPREPPLWRAADIALAIAVWFGATLIVGMAFVGSRPGAGPTAPAVLALSLVPNLAALGCIHLAVRGRLGQPWSAVGFVPASLANAVPVLATYVLFLAPFLLVAALWYVILSTLGVKPVEQDFIDIYRESLDTGDTFLVAAVWVSAVLIAPFFEEAIYRGFFFGWLRESLGPGLAALLSSAVFSAVHFSLSAAAPLVAIGCVLCYLYERTRSLHAPIFFHALFNGVNLLGLTV